MNLCASMQQPLINVVQIYQWLAWALWCFHIWQQAGGIIPIIADQNHCRIHVTIWGFNEWGWRPTWRVIGKFFFIVGLKPEIKSQLKVNRPNNLRKGFCEGQNFWGLETEQKIQRSILGDNKLEPHLKTPTVGTPPNLIVRWTLTTKERKEQRAKGLCFNYDEKYSLGHRCKGQLFKLDSERACLLEGFDAEPETGDEL